nr:hypothetical protein [Tanacetum cinerariifolium]
MTSFAYRLNPLYPIKECLALYTTDYCCSVGALGDKVICDLDKTTDFSQRSPQDCPKCGNPVKDHYCQGCAALRKKFKEDLFASDIKHGIFQDSSEPSNDNSNVVNAPREPFVVNHDLGKDSSQSPPQINHHCCYGCGDPLEGIFFHQCTCKLCGNGAYYGYNCPPKVPIIPNPEPFNNQTIKELPPTVQSLDSKYDLVHKSPNVFNLPPQLSFISCEFCENDACYVTIVYLKFRLSIRNSVTIKTLIFRKNFKIPACYNDDDDYNFALTPNKKDNSLSMGDEHPDTVPATELDEFIKLSVENLVPIPSESKDESECDVPAREEFTTFSNVLFDADYEFDSSDDQPFSDEDVPEKIFSNPLFEEEIIHMKIDQHHYNAESDIIESLHTHDSSLIISLKIDSLLDEFAHIRLIEKLLYDNSSPRPPEEFVSENSDAKIESFSPSPIPVEDIDSLMKEIDLSFNLNYPIPPGIEDDDYDSEREILISEDLPSNDTLSLPEIESFHFDIPSFSRPPAKPPDGNTGILNAKMMGDISEQKVSMPKLMITLVPNQEKSPDLLSHLGLKAFQPFAKYPMMIHGKNTPILGVPLFHFYPP